ncbi:monovalent cation/H+ antiporter subunit C [Arsukibacterium ikkense]|uniref:Monovalent cation/H+ antiporter subunit C n=1 Tax=Arsukibacterium ikkense TaxID=336831 RepID=A0A0M2V9E3_9GAMM|nr:Na+/H+ antiporter subunit C [Arsukibacterium ikkense]KKO46260.1 monovalent cation/H+ antiporter subunit C [Arsukibacterium ikkense]
MTSLLAILIGCLYAAAIYMMLRRSVVKLVIGLILLSNAANLLIFTAAGLERGVPPLIEEGQQVIAGTAADPLAQALILTAIVIGFGVLAFAVVLIHRACEVVQTDDMNEMKGTD